MFGENGGSTAAWPLRIPWHHCGMWRAVLYLTVAESPREAGFDLQSKMLRGMRELSGVSALAPRSRIQAYPSDPSQRTFNAGCG